MKNKQNHIESAILSRSPGISYGDMYSMHRYWSKKSPDVVTAYIEKYTEPGDIVLDPFCGSGIVPCEAVRLGRRAIAIDINPMATFITKMTLTPVNLSRLQWVFYDLKSKCEKAISELFFTSCYCCHKDALVEFVIRDGDIPIQIGYKCTCSDDRLFKDADKRDKNLDYSIKKEEIPFWYPNKVQLPFIQKEKYKFVHELFTRRNLIALSMIFNAIEEIDESKIREVMKFVFTAALDKCSRLKPFSKPKGDSRPSLSEGWVAVRFYTPRMWQEVNPWHVFSRSFEQVYKGKRESNDKLKSVIIGSHFAELSRGDVNVIIITGTADTILNERLPKNSVDYVLTDPPFGGSIQYLSLSAFWGAWLRYDFNYDKEVIVNHHRGKTLEDYERRLAEIFQSVDNVTKLNSYVHTFCHDVHGPYFHKILRSMSEAKIVPERIIHQPPPNSFGAAVRNISKTGRGHYGWYVVRGKLSNSGFLDKYSIKKELLKKKIASVAHVALKIRDGVAPIGIILHSIYRKLTRDEISLFVQYSAEDILKESIKKFAVINKDQVQLKAPKKYVRASKIKEEIKAALLDAKILYPDQKHQIYQRVLWRFQDEGITLDYITKIEQQIQAFEESEYRIKRYRSLIQLFGKELGIKCKLINKNEKRVIWQDNSGQKCSFLITDKEIVINKSYIINGNNIASDIGTISFLDFEAMLWKWCQNNPDKAQKLRNKINPVDETKKRQFTPKHLQLKVLKNRELCPKHYLITLNIPRGLNLEPKPGQFFHIVCDPERQKFTIEEGKERSYALTLRRPFSVHRIYYTNFDRRLLAMPSILPYEIRDIIQRPVSEIDILYKVIGEGTKNLSQICPGTLLDMIGPNGNGFEINRGTTAVIVAGGIGVAPLVALAERLRYLDIDVFIYLGALTHELLLPVLSRPDSIVEFGFANGIEFCKLIINEFTEIGVEKVRVCTDDGSVGEKGLVTEVLKRDLNSGYIPNKNIVIYTCGPTKMISMVSNITSKYNIPCQILMEERMACGIGACLSCTCNVREKNGDVQKKRVCIEGPVFNSKDIIWPSLE